MNFFKQLSEVGVQSLELKVTIKNEELSVMIIPEMKNGSAIPLVVSGTAEELDEGFFGVISTPLKKVAGLVSNVEDFEKSIAEKPAAASKGQKAKDDKSEAETKEETEKPVSKRGSNKKAPVYKHQKYLDAILNIVNAEGYTLTEENKTELSDAVDKLLVMDSKNETALEWEKKIKDLSPKEEPKVEEKEESAVEIVPVPESKEEKPVKEKPVEETKVEEKKATPPPAPPEPPVDDTESEDDFVLNDDDLDLDFDDFFGE